MKLTKAQREELRMMFGGLCAYCGCDLGRGWHADHIEPVMRDSEWVRVEGKPYTHVARQTGVLLRPENDSIENLFPACRPCNIDKSCYSLEDWRSMLEQRIRVLRDNCSAYRHAERFGLVAVVRTQVVFHFEKAREASSAKGSVETEENEGA